MSTFELYGLEFQSKIIFLLITDVNFCRYMTTALQPSFFDAEKHRQLAKLILNYFKQYKKKISQPALLILIQKEYPKAVAEYKGLLDEIFKIGEKADDLDFVRGETKVFCENQDIKNTLTSCVDLLEGGEYDQIKKQVGSLIKHETDFDIGLTYANGVDDRYQQGPREVIPTPWEPLNENIGGGAGKGELYVMMAPPGIGKCVGPDTVIRIQYPKHIIFIRHGLQVEFPHPWTKYKVYNQDNGKLIAEAYPHNLHESLEVAFKDTKIEYVEEDITMRELFYRLQIPDQAHAELIPEFTIKVLTPKGYKRIAKLWRTEVQPVAEVKLHNHPTGIITGLDHQFKTLRGWTKVKDLVMTDIIIAKEGAYHFMAYSQKEPQVLYDISVEEEHCYYSNDLLSHNSWTLINVAAHAALQQKKVVFYTLELNPNYVGYRFDAHYTKINISDIIANPSGYQEEISAFIDEKKPPLTIKYYKRKTASVDSLRAHIELLISDGFKPDIIVIDYADLLRPGDKKDQLRFMLDNIYEELINLAVDYQVPVWTATQTNRGSVDKSIIGNESVAESFNKVAVADVVISLSRTAADKGVSSGRFYLSKNRYGGDGKVFQAEFNLGFGDIKISEESQWVEEFEDNKAKATKKSLKEKLKKFQTQS